MLRWFGAIFACDDDDDAVARGPPVILDVNGASAELAKALHRRAAGADDIPGLRVRDHQPQRRLDRRRRRALSVHAIVRTVISTAYLGLVPVSVIANTLGRTRTSGIFLGSTRVAVVSPRLVVSVRVGRLGNETTRRVIVIALGSSRSVMRGGCASRGHMGRVVGVRVVVVARVRRAPSLRGWLRVALPHRLAIRLGHREVPAGTRRRHGLPPPVRATGTRFQRGWVARIRLTA